MHLLLYFFLFFTVLGIEPRIYRPSYVPNWFSAFILWHGLIMLLGLTWNLLFLPLPHWILRLQACVTKLGWILWWLCMLIQVVTRPQGVSLNYSVETILFALVALVFSSEIEGCCISYDWGKMFLSVKHKNCAVTRYLVGSSYVFTFEPPCLPQLTYKWLKKKKEGRKVACFVKCYLFAAVLCP